MIFFTIEKGFHRGTPGTAANLLIKSNPLVTVWERADELAIGIETPLLPRLEQPCTPCLLKLVASRTQAAGVAVLGRGL